MKSRTNALAFSLAASVLLVGCAGTSSTSEQSSPEPTAASSSVGAQPNSAAPAGQGSAAPTSPPTSEAPSGPVLEIEIDGDSVTPNAAELRLGVGNPLTVSVTSDRAGELHVHAKPEQYLRFAPGSTVQTLMIQTPGEVEIEDHDSGAVVAILQVR